MPPTPPPTKYLSADNIPGIFSSDNISLAVPDSEQGERPSAVKHMSTPAYQSPLRHHRRAPSRTRQVKETLNAHSEYSNSEDDGTAQHRINQYLIKQEIGRGSFGAVHLAVDQYGQEYAVKEFSKSRLRKRAQSNLLRRPDARRRPGALAAGLGFNSPLHRHSSSDADPNNSLDLIKEEIAIMKKLNHPNVVSLIEVLDDPEEDSLYMVMEMCKKGVVMRVSLEERADPYCEEKCRCWFRDMILGIEYLHAQGIIHRDIKPDNCLITDDDVLKIVDFGVSEMFEKESEMQTAKSAGSPAFMPPELCVAKHGQVSGRAADIWSMGVTLYCLRFGKIPFEKTGMLELYDSIRNDNVDLEGDCDEDLKDILGKLLEKDPAKRIKMEEIREHPWVTKRGTDPLLPTSENIAIIVEPPTEEEVNAAITGNMGHLITVVRAVKRFKQLLFKRRPELMEGILGSASRIVQPPLSMRSSSDFRKSKSQDTDNRRPIEGALTAEGIHRDIEISDNGKRLPDQMNEMGYSSLQKSEVDNPATGTIGNVKDRVRRGLEKYTKITAAVLDPNPGQAPEAKVDDENLSARPTLLEHKSSSSTTASPTPPRDPTALGKGQAHDPLEDTLFLRIGTGPSPTSTNSDTDNANLTPDSIPIVSESPSAVDIDVYETAYQEEITKILKKKEEEGGRRPTLYLTRRVEGVKSIRENEFIFDTARLGMELPKVGFAKLVEKARKVGEGEDGGAEGEGLLSKGLKSWKGVVGEERGEHAEGEQGGGDRGREE
ncbi:Pkinase-domain-containing protein [Lepidopterella palustris CBS 459.81]|uniref:Pkinase-domain-containing protein n=1 Tax=Lepidopterella palustris CBS 459.81 TaxID=1314670 RepID=A0A8E2EEU0_9PEZI|nr:Pkinase-domain-containing protein [Lepidopterella palustris CBS 459.81]